MTTISWPICKNKIYICIKAVQLAERFQCCYGCHMLKRQQSHSPAPDNPQQKWSQSPALRQDSHLSFESSPSRCTHLLGSLSPFAFKVARFRAINPLTLLLTMDRKSLGVRMLMACHREPGHPWTVLQHQVEITT